VASYAVTVSSGSYKIESSHLPAHLSADLTQSPNHDANLESEKLKQALEQWISSQLNTSEKNLPPNYRDLAGKVERLLIQQLLKRYDGKLSRLATEMNANRSTLRKKLKKQKTPS